MPAEADGDGPGAELARYRSELDRLRQAALELRRACHEGERELERVRARAEAAERRCQELRAHPALRASNKLGRVLRRLRPGRGAVLAPGAGPAPPPDAPRSQVVHRAPVEGPAVYRRRLLRSVAGDGDDPLEVAVAGTPGGLVEALERLGWRVRPLPAPDTPARADALSAADVVVVTDPAVDVHALPRHPVLVGLAGGSPGPWLARPWFDDLDVVLVDDEAAARAVAGASAKTAAAAGGAGVSGVLRARLEAWAAAVRVSVAVATPSREVSERWGDTHFGRALQRALERLGHPTRLYLRDAFAAPELARSDLALHLAGLATPEPHPAQVSLLWVISHPERVTEERCRGYHLVLAASERFAAESTPLLEAPVLPLAQATDPERFHPDPTGPPHDLLFVGNSRRTRRRIIDDLTPTAHDLAVYGGDWTPDLLDPGHLRGEVVPNAELHRYYSSAKIVLNDHWPDMAERGFVSNRVYDALASGAMVVSDPVEGLERAFDGAVVTYRDRAELRRLVDRYLADEGARRERAERGRRAVLERHTFTHRAERITALAQPLLEHRPGALR